MCGLWAEATEHEVTGLHLPRQALCCPEKCHPTTAGHLSRVPVQGTWVVRMWRLLAPSPRGHMPLFTVVHMQSSVGRPHAQAPSKEQCPHPHP